MTASATLHSKSLKNRILIKAGIIAIWFLLWQLLSVVIGSAFLFPSPVTVVKRLCELAVTGNFAVSCLLSLGRVLAGYLIGIAAGTLMGVITAFSKTLRAFFAPLLTVIKTTPVASFIILLLIWMKRTGVTVTVSSILVAPVVWTNVCAGLMNTDRNLLEMSDIYRFSTHRKIRYIYIPAVFPHFSSACMTAIGFAWKAGISAEVIAVPLRAIGTSLYHAKINLNYTDLFAWTLAVVLLSLIVEKLLVLVLERFVFGRAVR